MTATWRPRNVPVPEAYLAGLVAGVVAQRVRPWHLALPKGFRHLVAWPAAIAGAGLIVAAVRAAGTVDIERPHRLVVAGPYAYTRNPMYVGWALLGVAAGVLARSGWILAAVPLTAAWTHRDILREERRLTESFGAEFGGYRAAVPRYLGRPRHRRPGSA
jgi:protein-S-isoprenylcysteine O-methyltransferase Ste14